MREFDKIIDQIKKDIANNANEDGKINFLVSDKYPYLQRIHVRNKLIALAFADEWDSAHLNSVLNGRSLERLYPRNVSEGILTWSLDHHIPFTEYQNLAVLAAKSAGQGELDKTSRRIFSNNYITIDALEAYLKSAKTYKVPSDLPAGQVAEKDFFSMYSRYLTLAVRKKINDATNQKELMAVIESEKSFCRVREHTRRIFCQFLYNYLNAWLPFNKVQAETNGNPITPFLAKDKNPSASSRIRILNIIRLMNFYYSHALYERNGDEYDDGVPERNDRERVLENDFRDIVFGKRDATPRELYLLFLCYVNGFLARSKKRPPFSNEADINNLCLDPAGFPVLDPRNDSFDRFISRLINSREAAVIDTSFAEWPYIRNRIRNMNIQTFGIQEDFQRLLVP